MYSFALHKFSQNVTRPESNSPLDEAKQHYQQQQKQKPHSEKDDLQKETPADHGVESKPQHETDSKEATAAEESNGAPHDQVVRDARKDAVEDVPGKGAEETTSKAAVGVEHEDQAKGEAALVSTNEEPSDSSVATADLKQENAAEMKQENDSDMVKEENDQPLIKETLGNENEVPAEKEQKDFISDAAKEIQNPANTEPALSARENPRASERRRMERTPPADKEPPDQPDRTGSTRLKARGHTRLEQERDTSGRLTKEQAAAVNKESPPLDADIVAARERRAEQRSRREKEYNASSYDVQKAKVEKPATVNNESQPLDENDAGAPISRNRQRRAERQVRLEQERRKRKVSNSTMTSPPPLRDPLMHSPKKGAVHALPFTPAVPYLGILVDAGRHYYTIPWLKRLIRYLHFMRYNLIHFRLTDDQAFNVRLDSHPEFAKPSAVHSNGTVYTPSELRDLVAYANKRNITIMPEINVPGHAGAWHGIPGMLVPCPKFICTKGYGVPLNIRHPKAMGIIKDVLKEVMEIFSTSPFLHLGGDEVHMSAPCFSEAGMAIFDYESFERKLADILKELPPKEIVRWEMTGQQDSSVRVVSQEHYWLTRNYRTDENGTVYPFFASQGLYFDTNKQNDAYEIYETTRAYLTSANRPTAIIAGAFELGMDTWFDRNIMGRLVAVAMGASGLSFTEDQTKVNSTSNTSTLETTSPDAVSRRLQENMYRSYFRHCKSLAFDEALCALYGKPAVSEAQYKLRWDQHWVLWREDICNRLTVSGPGRAMSSGYGSGYGNRREQLASTLFWDSFMSHRTHPLAEENFDRTKLAEKQLPDSIRHQNIAYRGIILDLVNDFPGNNPTERLEQIINVMADLGFNLLQVRLMDDLGMAMELSPVLRLRRTDVTSINYDSILPHIVQYAFERGIMVMPEISITTRAGGWSDGVEHIACPNVICDKGYGLAIRFSQTSLLPVIANVLHNTRGIFSSKFIHLGFDEREESMSCFREAKLLPDFDAFEEKLQELLRIERIPLEHVLRWENAEQTNYTQRAGGVTHYRLSHGPNNTSVPWFVSTDLTLDDPETSPLNAYKLYKNTRKLAKKSPMGILASVGVLNVTSWDILNVKGRLLAFAMGLSSQALDSKTFRATYNQTCHELGYHCDVSKSSNITKQWREERKQAAQNRVDTACYARTRQVTVVTSRKGVLV